MSLILGLVLSSCATQSRNARRTSASYSKYMKGLLNDRLGNVEEAITFYQEVKDLEKGASSPYLQLGLDYIRLKKFQQATTEFKKIVELTPDDDYVRYVLALLYVQLADFRNAAGQYEKLLEKNLSDRAQNFRLRHILSQLYFLEGDYAAAKRHSESLLRLDPMDVGGLYVLSMIYSQEGQVDKAIAGYKEIIEYYPDQAEAMNALAYLYAEEDMKLQEALAFSERALKFEPANGAYLDTLGWIYFKMGQIDEAIVFLDKASKLMYDPVILNHLAEAYYKQGNTLAAKKHWSSSLVLDPTQKDVRKKLNAL